MHVSVKNFASWLIGVACAAGVVCAFWVDSTFLTSFAAVVALCLAAMTSGGVNATAADACDDSSKLVHEMLRQRRYALLLRHEVAESLSEPQIDELQCALNSEMSLSLAGPAVFNCRSAHSIDGGAISCELEAFYIDRMPVANRDFHEFVVAGAYEESVYWDSEIWPLAGRFVDQTGQPGPRFWNDGRFDRRLGDRPVVGVCWYEAAAYARWAGKRLPTDPQWVRAADQGVFDPTLSIVWEWMQCDFDTWTDPRDRLATDDPMKSLRGGAFDSYFEEHATSQFQSAERILSRRPNIGFRCVSATSDLAIPSNGTEQRD